MWLIFALLGMFSLVLLGLGQQILKTEAIPMLVSLRVMSMVIMGIALPYFSLPDNISFYILCAIYGLFIALLDTSYFGYIKNHGAAVPARIGASTSILSFILWVLIDHDTFHLTSMRLSVRC